MGFYENVRIAAKDKGYSINRLEQEIGFPRSTIHKWDSNTPGVDKLMKVAEFLGVTVDELCTGRKSHYLDDDTAKVAQEAFDSPEMQLLFDAAKGSTAEDILLARQMLLAIKRNSGNV